MALYSARIKTLSVAFLVGLVHLTAGIGVIVQPSALTVTAFAQLRALDTYFGAGAPLAGVVMIVAGCLAMAGCTSAPLQRSLVAILFLPQQILLLLQLVSISEALLRGAYPDGYVPVGGGWFILADQSWAWVLAISHTVWLTAALYRGEPERGGS
jgi:hypothetical protein